MKKKSLTLIICLMMVLSALPVFIGPSSARGITRATTVYTTVESAHPYSNNFDYTWTISQPGATEMRVHFTKIDTERRYDYVYVYDGDWNRIYSLTGLYSSGGWTTWIDGDTVYVRLDTDYSVTDWGFAIDQYQYEGGTVDTTPPSVSITNPSNGATVSGTVSFQASASDNVGVTKVEFYIDNVLKGTDTTSSYSYSWDTTGYANDDYSLKAIAYDAAGNTGTETITVTVDNGGGGGGSELTSGVTVYSNLNAQYATEMWTIQVDEDCDSMHAVLNCGSADFDLYGRLGAEPTTSTYDWRGYTYGGEDVTTSYPGEGTWYIMVRSYSGTGDYDLTVTLTYGGGGGGGDWGTGGKYAIIVGISDYAYINDLSYCDEDATDWYNQLNSMGYECHVYGDGHTSNYPRHDGYATEANVRADLQALADHAGAGDSVCYITSGHGDGTGTGSSYLCMYDCSGSSGCYYDTELASDISGFDSGVDIFVFIDHCYSGGMGPELMSLSINDYIYCTTTCTDDGYGYDDSSHQNGAWTYYFLDYSWQSHYGGSSSTAMETVFDYAHNAYPHGGGDEPEEFDGYTGSYFYL